MLENKVPQRENFRFPVDSFANIVCADPDEVEEAVMIAEEVMPSRPCVTILTSTIAATASSHV